MKNLFTIPPHLPFLDRLAEGIWAMAESDPAKLASMQVLLPTRRACRAMQTAFLRVTGAKAALLPRLSPIGDIDEEELLFSDIAIDAIPPAIDPMRRRFLLGHLIQRRDESLPPAEALRLADALARFLDEAQIRHCDFARLPGLVEDRELAKHWEETVKFLGILTDAWPKILADEGCIDPAERRNRVLAAQAAAWRAKPPAFPVIAAGSTGTMPATADVLDAIASLPQGAVVLPGLDRVMDEESWQAADELHPQYGMKELLRVMDTERGQVKDWVVAPFSPRARLLAEAMRPAAVTDAWRHLRQSDLLPESFAGLSRATFAHPQEEAQAVALMLRGAMNEPERTAALVTPDRDLAGRVAALLARWGITANDSAATSLAERPVGGFLAAVLDAAAPDAGAVAWLSLLKHPYAASGLDPALCRAEARQAELTHFRKDPPEASPWFDAIKNILKPLTLAWPKRRAVADWLGDHLRLAEQLAASDAETGAARLWKGEDGDAATTWIDDVRRAAEHFLPVSGEDYRNLFTELLRQAGFRPTHGAHPRLSILGPLEARLLRPDFVVLGGMNEGVWPPEPAIDPWMSRPMKKAFGMMPSSHRIGLSAHDFAQLAQAPQVVMTRSVRSGGAPTVPSRFLLQLETVLRAAGHAGDPLTAQEPWQDWARTLDEPPAGEIKACLPPEPKPAVELRPAQLSVTEIGLWQRNPYAIYARHVLGLRKLDPLEGEPDAADRGELIHSALEKFTVEYPNTLPSDAFDKLIAIGRELFAAYDGHAEVKAFWWPRFERAAAWFIETESARRAAGIRPLAAEISGRTALDGFTLTGRADRVDRLPEGKVAIVDYKTGGVPSKKDVETGLEPQLPLLSLIAANGGFANIGAADAGELSYWKMGGGQGDKSNGETRFDEHLEALRHEAEEGLKSLVAAFADPETAYHAVPKPGRAPKYDDYAHLARLAEWGRTTED